MLLIYVDDFVVVSQVAASSDRVLQFQGEEISLSPRGLLSERYTHSECEIDAQYYRIVDLS